MRRYGGIAVVSIAGLVAAAGAARAQAPDTASEKPAADQTKADRHVVESKVHFDFDSAELSAEAKAELDEAAKWIAANQEAGLILVEGHADKVGGAPYNKELAARRAASAKIYLLSRGVKAEQIRILSYGEGLPAEETDAPSRVNRRIVLLAVQKEPIVDTRVKTRIEKVPVPQPYTVEKVVVVDRPVAVGVPIEPELLGFDILAGGGVIAFVDDHTNDVTDAGGMWTARVVAFTGRLVGFEAAYVGSAQDIEAIGLDDNATLLGNGVEGNVRLNVLRGTVVQPFLFAGLGWTHYAVTNSDVATASIDDEDDVLHVPAGVGLSLRFPRRVTLDVRGTYRGAAGDGMFHGGPGDEGEKGGLESLAGTAQFGFTF